MTSLFLYHLIAFSGAFVLSLILTPIMRRIAISSGRVSFPKHDRWHRKETALLGGVSIFATTSIAWITVSASMGWNLLSGPCFPLLVGAAAVFALGLADDILNMDPQHKLAGQIIITSVMVFFGFRLGWTDSKTVNLFLSILWIVGVTNAFNLLDNMDGLAAGVAFIAGTFLFFHNVLGPEPAGLSTPVFLLLMTYLGSILGFLVYNFYPASIFMGDAGSQFIGFMLGCLTVIGSPAHSPGGGFLNLLSVIAIPILILFIPILDTGFVSLMRKLFHRRISQGGLDHSSHRMVAIGFSERKAVLVLYGFAAISGLIALAITRLSLGLSLVTLVLYLLFVLFFWIYLSKVKVYEEPSILSQKGSSRITPLLVEITYKRRLFEVLLDFILVTVAYYMAYLLRFEGDIGANLEFYLKSLPILIACQILCFYVMGVYRGVWESTSLRDIVGYIKAITAGTVLAILIILSIYRFQGFSRAVFASYWVLMLIMVSLSRLSFRLVDEGIKKGNQKGKPTLIYGAGVGGQILVKEIETNRELGLALVGFIDDNPRIQRSKIKGYPIFGTSEDLESVVKEYAIREIIVSFRHNGLEKQKEISRLCQGIGLPVKVRQMRLIIT